MRALFATPNPCRLSALSVGESIVLPTGEYDPDTVLRAEIKNGHRYVMQPMGTSEMRVTRWA